MLNCKGLVIRENSSGESSKIINILTPQNGVLTATVRSAKKINGNALSGTQLFAYSDFSLNPSKNWYYVDTAIPVNIFFKLRSNLKKLSLAQYFMQIIYECIMPNQNSEEILRLTLNSLYFLEKDLHDIRLLKSIFELRFLSLTGLMPSLLACQADAEYLPKVPVFLISFGTFYCDKCLQYAPPHNKQDEFCMTSTVLTAIRKICLSDMKDIFNFKIDEENTEILCKFSEKYTLARLKRGFTSLDFYNSIMQ